jgi:hypothetical protein
LETYMRTSALMSPSNVMPISRSLVAVVLR